MLNGNKKYKKKMKLLRDSAQRTEHYKMYKIGRNWLFAGITILGLCQIVLVEILNGTFTSVNVLFVYS
ncbi:KxYKxGKxW signal peptide domain-containing protein [Pediococcus damnosus]|uniref:KxYKxGKxW signal peptide domain-containing protein n=1 Tax=Pediococcus damnosus TaxID=51663 RepID=UPI001303F8D1|nr:KxYKxGKxW signal peptide domain-containing protein [Pediococcus damnosus]